MWGRVEVTAHRIAVTSGPKTNDKISLGVLISFSLRSINDDVRFRTKLENVEKFGELLLASPLRFLEMPPLSFYQAFRRVLQSTHPLVGRAERHVNLHAARDHVSGVTSQMTQRSANTRSKRGQISSTSTPDTSSLKYRIATCFTNDTTTADIVSFNVITICNLYTTMFDSQNSCF